MQSRGEGWKQKVLHGQWKEIEALLAPGTNARQDPWRQQMSPPKRSWGLQSLGLMDTFFPDMKGAGALGNSKHGGMTNKINSYLACLGSSPVGLGVGIYLFVCLFVCFVFVCFGFGFLLLMFVVFFFFFSSDSVLYPRLVSNSLCSLG